MLAYFLRRVRDHAEAEDLAQDVLIRLMKHEGTEIASPEAYVFQMASNLLADRTRRQKVRSQYREMVLQAEDRGIDVIDPYRVAAGRAQIAAISTALGLLPERTRTIFILYRIENFGQEAIADSFGLSVSAVKKHVAKAMAKLAQAIEVAE